LATSAKNVQIGAGTVGSSAGRIRIAAANRGKGTYNFAFATWPANATKQNPVAIVGGKAIVAATAAPQAANGVTIVRMAKR
jgi:hypothetical protein